MADDLSPHGRLSLITSHLAEILHPDILSSIVLTEKRPLKIYWGTATTGRPHCAYFVPLLKIAHFLRAGCNVKILLADIHGFLDNLKAPLELVNYRAEYYKYVITALLEAIDVPIQRLEFVLGSSYQKSEKYFMDFLRLSTLVTTHDAKKAGAEVVKQVENATLSGLLYPLMQALDEEHLGVDAQFGGVDQRKIFALAAECLPKIGYRERCHLMNPMVPGLAGGKMSSSEPDSKIDVLDTPEAVTKKLKKAQCAPRTVEGNGVLSFVEYVLLPISALKTNNNGAAKFVIEKSKDDKKDEEPLVYTDIESLKRDYEADIVTPQLLKQATTTSLLTLLSSVQASFASNSQWQEVEKLAYPPADVKKKDKKAKNKGSKYPGSGSGAVPGGSAVEAQPDGHVEGPEKRVVEQTKGTAEEVLEKLKAAQIVESEASEKS